MQELISRISRINESFGGAVSTYLFFPSNSAKESASLMDLNIKPMKEHVLAYRDKFNFLSRLLESEILSNGINKMALSQMGECMNPACQ